MTSKEQNPQERPGIDGLTPVDREPEPYDTTRDPRTGRPPNPLEAQRLAREHEQRLAAEHGGLSEEDFAAEGDFDEPGLPEEQKPGRMISPKDDEEEKAAADALVEEGVTREQAEELVKEHGTNLETLKAAAFAGEHVDARKEALALHHEEGIPPLEPPQRDNHG